MRLALLLGILPLCLASPQVAQAEDETSSENRCHSYDPDPACTLEERDYWRATFGLPKLEGIHRRLGTGRDLIIGMVRIKTGERLALVFHGNRNGTATAEIYRRPRDAKRLRPRLPLRVPISAQVWRDIVTAGSALPDVFAREEVYTCGATFMIEFRDSQGVVRSPVGDACGNEPRGEYFKLLADAVIDQIPYCRSRGTQPNQDSLDQLTACKLL